jgi:hypothetical protein
MKKAYSLFIGALLISLSSLAQDVLVMKDGSRINAIIEAVGEREVRYHLFDSPQGILYTRDIKNIVRIEFENGTAEDLSEEKKRMAIQAKNLMGYNYFDLATLNFSFYYERLLNDEGSLSLYLPIRIGFASEASYVDDPNIFGTGLGVMVYPFGQRKFSYYTGPMVHYSLRESYYSYEIYNDATQQYEYYSGRDNHNYLGGYVVNGLKMNFNENLGINFNLALGFLLDMNYEENRPNGLSSYYYYNSYQSRFHGMGDISLFYRF